MRLNLNSQLFTGLASVFPFGACLLINTVALARCRSAGKPGELFQQLATWQEKPLKRLKAIPALIHRAKAAVLMRCPRCALAILALAGLFIATGLSLSPCDAAEAEPRILVYTKNQIGKGLYVHDNIPASVEAIKKLGTENHFGVDVSNDPAVFTGENLKRYRVIVFDNTNNEIFDSEEQKAAFQAYIRAGGGFVGIHSASGSMRKWPWFWSVLGGKFIRHAKMQSFTVYVKDAKDSSTAHLPATFEWTDEFYYVDHMPDDLHVLLAGDLTKLDDPGKEKYPGKKFGDEFPLAWRHQFDGGREWYTALGHKPEHYSDPKFTKLILGGILWAMGEVKRET